MMETKNGIVKVCFKHGKLTIEQVNRNKNGGKLLYRCKQCQKESHRQHYLRHKEEVLEKQREYKRMNLDRVLATKNKSYKKNKHKYRESHVINNRRWHAKNKHRANSARTKRKRAARENLADSYIKSMLTKRSPLTSKDIPQSLIHTQRILLILKREICRRKEN